MNLLKLNDPDDDVICPNEKCNARYQWDYNKLQFTFIGSYPGVEIKAHVREYTRVLNSENWEDKDQMHYCAMCSNLIAISYTTDFEAGQSHLYIPTKE